MGTLSKVGKCSVRRVVKLSFVAGLALWTLFLIVTTMNPNKVSSIQRASAYEGLTKFFKVGKIFAENRSSPEQRENVTGQPTGYPPPVTPLTILPNGTVYDVTAPVSGQLGNRMFQYASLLGIAYLNGMKPFYGSSSKLQNFFQVTHIQDRPTKNFAVVSEQDFASYDPRFEKLRQVNTIVVQYLQSWKYFHFIRDTIRKEFTFKDSVRTSAAGLLKPFSGSIGSKVKVGVHIRRGDMLLRHHILKGYHIAPTSYIFKAMDYMRHNFSDVIFVIVTDDVNWCRSTLNGTDHVIVDRAAAEVHMAVLASCDHVIMTVGTYGWWGGYLSGGEVVYYWDPKELVHNPPLPVELRKPQDFYPPDWVPLAG